MEKNKATRMEYLKLKKRLKTAKKGYKLLKEKRDGLMKQFLDLIRQAKSERSDLQGNLSNATWHFAVATSYLSEGEINQMFTPTDTKINVSAPLQNIMSVWIPTFSFEIEGDYRTYSDFTSPWGIEESLENMRGALDKMVKLAGIEHSARLLSFEIEKTRRRVNALEYVVIPNIQRQMKFIRSKLDEAERAEKIVRMKLKEIITT